MVCFDSGFLAILFNPDPGIPHDPSTGQEVPHAKQRIEFLVDTLSKEDEQILIPTPALSEVLIALGKTAASQAVDEIHGESAFKVEAFDERAAIELALMSELVPGQKKRKEQEGTWAKIKFDRQIVAIAKVNGVSSIYTTDKDVRNLAISQGLTAIALHDLPLPPPTTPNMFEVTNAEENPTE